MEYKVGDWVYVWKNDTPGCLLEIGHVDQVIQIFKNEKFLTVKSLKREGGDIRFTDIRHAYNYEIPGYVSPKSENYKELKRILKQLKIK
jgi:hypothetical protein